MEKLRIEVSTHPAISFAPALGVCAICGLISTPLFAAESPVQSLPPAPIQRAKPSATPSTNSKTPLRPMAFRQITTAKSSAKSQVSKARNSPLQTLKPTASSQVKRFALTGPAAETGGMQDDNSFEATSPAIQTANPQFHQGENAASDERIIMTALPTATAFVQNAEATAQDSPSINTVAANNDTTPENLNIETDNAETDKESEPLTGTVTLGGNAPQPVSTAPSPASVPASSEIKPNAPGQNESTPVAAATTADSKLAQTARLFAPNISFEGGVVIAEGTDEEPVRFEGTDTRILARKVRLDTTNQSVVAEGKVRVERQVKTTRFSTFAPNKSGGRQESETITETLQGENFQYNYGTRKGKLDATRVRLANFNISAEEIIINGTTYVARNVIIRPGGLSNEEIKIYGTPPFWIKASKVTIDTSKAAPVGGNLSDTPQNLPADSQTTASTQVQGAALYFKNFRLFPIPSSLLGRSLGGPREQETYQLTPRVSYNSADGALVTVGLKYPLLTANPDRLLLRTDIGLSTRVGFRGGATLTSKNQLGRFSIGARINDVISSQLTNRIELDRLPEVSYQPPRLALFTLPGGRQAGLQFDFSAGDYRERFTSGRRVVSSSRLQAQVLFTTRMGKRTGPYLDLLARAAGYSANPENLSTAGFEVGYVGSLGSRISGQFSLGATKVNGSTPFEFDKVSIQKELRATFDILLTPRYIIPIDLRYDLGSKQLREKTFGVLRNYKTFAYGFTYQASRQELQFQVRQGF